MPRHPDVDRTPHRQSPVRELREDPREVASRTHEYGERPHGWGSFETNYDLASSAARRVDPGFVRADSPRPDLPDHRGKGPQGYRRSDERLREIACELLMEDPRIDATDVDVHVQDGQTTLTGFVDSRRTKYLIEDLLAHALRAEIMNRLQVRRSQEARDTRTPPRWPLD